MQIQRAFTVSIKRTIKAGYAPRPSQRNEADKYDKQKDFVRQ